MIVFLNGNLLGNNFALFLFEKINITEGGIRNYIKKKLNEKIFRKMIDLTNYLRLYRLTIGF